MESKCITVALVTLNDALMHREGFMGNPQSPHDALKHHITSL